MGAADGGSVARSALGVRVLGGHLQALLAVVPSDVHDASLLADMPYDSAELRKMLEANGNRSVIPSNPTRAVQYALDRHTYRERWLVEDFFRRLKRYRRIATRYEKRARMFFAFVLLASVLIWLA